MSETRIYSNTKRHGDSANMFNTGSGVDTHTFTLPPGKQYTRYEVQLLTLPGLTGYEVVRAPKRGATGAQRIQVKWHFAPFNHLGYRLRVYAGAPGPVTIEVGGNDWINRAYQAIEQKLTIALKVVGPDVANLMRIFTLSAAEPMPIHLLPGFDTPDPTPPDEDAPQAAAEPEFAPEADPVTLALISAGTVLALATAGFALMAWVLTEAMKQGYEVKVEHRVSANPLESHIIIHVEPPDS